jgi:hypothetical protein
VEGVEHDREADGRPRAAEAAAEAVIATAHGDGLADPARVGLEDHAGVVRPVAHHAQVDHDGVAGAVLADERQHPRHSLARGGRAGHPLADPVQHLGAAAQSGQPLHEPRRRALRRPPGEAPPSRDVTGGQGRAQGRPQLGVGDGALEHRPRQRHVRDADREPLQPGRGEAVGQQGDRLGVGSGAVGAHQLHPGLALLGGARPPDRRRPEGARQVERPHRARVVRHPGRDEPRHRDREVGSQHQHPPVVVEEPERLAQPALLGPVDHLGELQHRRHDLAVAVAGEALAQGGLDRPQLLGLHRQHVLAAGGQRPRRDLTRGHHSWTRSMSAPTACSRSSMRS